MIRYTLKRLLSLCISLAVASLVIFTVIEVAPGDPASFMLGMNAQPETLAALRSELGLDASKPARYLAWVGGLLQGDFGTSYTYRTPVSEMIAARLWVSLPLALYALGLSTLIAFPAGIYAAARRGKAGDMGVMGATQLGVAVPNFWFAMILVLIFAINLRWFAAGGFVGWDQGVLTGLHALTLPAIALALPQAAILARVMRSALLDVLGEDYMRSARAKGLTETSVVVVHVFKNALIPLLTITGPMMANLITGSFFIETIFRIPGLGRYFTTSVFARDYPMIMATALLWSSLIVVIYVLTDIMYALADPRIRYRKD